MPVLDYFKMKVRTGRAPRITRVGYNVALLYERADFEVFVIGIKVGVSGGVALFVFYLHIFAIAAFGADIDNLTVRRRGNRGAYRCGVVNTRVVHSVH